jgi:hypothetical protein
MIKKKAESIQYLKGLIEEGHQEWKIRELWLFKYNKDVSTFYEHWSWAKYDKPTVKELTAKIRKPVKVVEFKGSGGRDYFGSEGAVENHHISYNPEIVVELTQENHRKIHALLSSYHKAGKQHQELIKDLQNRLQEIQKITTLTTGDIL